MSLVKQIKDDQLQARVNRDKLRVNILTSVYSDAVSFEKDAGRDITDAEVVSILKKYIKNLDAFKGTIGESQAAEEINILSAYLPEEPSHDQLNFAVASFVETLDQKSMKDMKLVMEDLSKRYPLGFDRAYASKFAKELLV